MIEAFTDDPEAMIQAGIEAARRAVSLDDKDAMSFSVMSRILAMGHEHDAAVAAGRMGVDLNPNIAQVRFGYASALVFADRLDEGLSELDKVIQTESAGSQYVVFHDGPELDLVCSRAL